MRRFGARRLQNLSEKMLAINSKCDGPAHGAHLG